jgi:hypothetical protein
MPAVNPPFDYEAATIFFNEIEHFSKFSQERGLETSRKGVEWSEAIWRIPCADQEAKSSGRARASSTIHSA